MNLIKATHEAIKQAQEARLAIHYGLIASTAGMRSAVPDIACHV